MPNPEEISSELQELTEKSLNHELTEAEASRLNQILPKDGKARLYFLKMQMLEDACHTNLTRNNELEQPVQFRRPAAQHPHRSKLLLAAVASIVLLGTLFILINRYAEPPEEAFQVVANRSNNSSFAKDSKFNPNSRIRLTDGSLDIVNPLNQALTISAPCDLTIIDAQNLLIKRGRVLARSNSQNLTFATPSGTITNIGTFYGVSVADPTNSRVDVFSGKVELAISGKEPAHIGDGLAATFGTKNWPPIEFSADPNHYQAPITTPIGINFSSFPSKPVLRKSPDSPIWSQVSSPSGHLAIDETPLKVIWVADSTHERPSVPSQELEPFRCHLRGYPVPPSSNPLSANLGLDHTRHGAAIHISGLESWLSLIQADRYQITVLRTVSRDDLTFLPLLVYESATVEKALPTSFKPSLEQVNKVMLPEVDNQGLFPALLLTQPLPPTKANDVIITTAPQQRLANSPKANIAAITITPKFKTRTPQQHPATSLIVRIKPE